MTARAIAADFCNFRRIRSRRVLVLEIEIPIEREQEVFAVLGFPDPATGLPVAIARLAERPPPRPAPERKLGASWSDLRPSQQAYLRCRIPQFQRFLQVDNEEEAAIKVRALCVVESRSELDTNEFALDLWRKLSSDYRAWGEGG